MASLACSAQEASPWAKESYSAVRLLAGSRGDGVLVGGIEVRLNPGWKTYWRTPGDSGVPPRFDFSRSDNIDTVTVLWPAPMKFSDGAGGYSIGYQDRVVLPLRIVPKDVAKPVVLRAAIDYAVCEKICIPVQAAAEVAFTATPSIHDGALAAALQSVPRPARIGEGEVTIRHVTHDSHSHRVLVDVAAPPGTPLALFVEGPTPDWALPLPQIASPGQDRLTRFAFELQGVPKDATIPGAALRMTLVAGDHAYDFGVTLN